MEFSNCFRQTAHFTLRILLTLLLALSVSLCVAQNDKDDKKSPVQVSGSLGLSSEFYNLGTTDSTNRPRYPDQLFRLDGAITFEISEYFSIPFEANLSNQDFNYNLPYDPNANFFEYVQNPRNNIAIHPRYKWAQAHLGTHVTDFSPLTTGDRSIFGVGLDLNPGKFIFSASYGTSQQAVAAVPEFYIPGTYKQNYFATRIGAGTPNKTSFTLNVVKIKDDLSSLNADSVTLDPVEGLTISPLLEVTLFKKLYISTETAGSAFTSNLHADTLELFGEEIEGEEWIDRAEKIMTINFSSRADFSHRSLIEYRSKKVTIGGEVQYFGPGFVPVGYQFIEKDYLDYKGNLGLRLLKGKVNFKTSVGWRQTNLAENKAQSTERLIVNTNLYARISKILSVSTSFNNFGLQSSNKQYTQVPRIETVNSNFLLSPMLSFQGNRFNQTVGLSYNLSNSDVLNPTTDKFVETTNTSYTGTYTFRPKRKPFTATLLSSFVQTDLPATSVELLNFGVTLSYQLLNKKLQPSVQVNHVAITRDEQRSSTRLTGRVSIRYRIMKNLVANASYVRNAIQYGESAVIGKDYTEHRTQLALTQTF